MFQRVFSGLVREEEPIQKFDLIKIANQACILNFPANAARAFWLTKITWSYDVDPVTGLLTIEDGAGNFIRRWYITKGGPGAIMHGVCKGSAGNAFIVTLAAVAGVKGTLAGEGLYRV